jgi:formylmethanofuran dehydrogenase subunit E
MECKKCGIDLAGREHRNVAQWPFCLECFQALMEKAEEKKGETDKTPPAPEPVRETKKCLVCEQEIEKGGGREMLGFVFCLQCYENLVKSPDIPPRTVSYDEEAGISPLEKQAVEQVIVDFTTSVQCSGCGREIPAISSKQFNEQPYCPDCYYTLPEIVAQQPRPFPAVVSGQPYKAEKYQAPRGEQETGLRCHACERQVLPDNLRTIEGFEICLACLTTDPDTALDIARTRHRKMLEKIKKELA